MPINDKANASNKRLLLSKKKYINKIRNIFPAKKAELRLKYGYTT